MAIYKPGPFVEAIFGSTKQATFRHREHFGDVQERASKPRTGRPGREAGTARIKQLSALWRALSDEQRAAWVEYADEIITLQGGPGNRSPSGWNRFCAANSILIGAGQPTVEDPPPSPSPEEASTGLDVRMDLDSQELVIRTLDGLNSVLLSPQNFRFRVCIPRPRSAASFRDTARITGFAADVDDFFPWEPTPLRLASAVELQAGMPTWITWQVATNNGAISPTRRTLVDVPNAQHITAFRLRNPLTGDAENTGHKASITAGPTLRVVRVTSGVGELFETGLRSKTVADVRTWLINTAWMELRDVATSIDSEPASSLVPGYGGWHSAQANLQLWMYPTP